MISELAEDDADWNPWGEEFENEQLVISHHEPPKILWNLELKNTVSNKGNNSTNRIFNVEVWGKAAIGKMIIMSVIVYIFRTPKECVNCHKVLSGR